MNSLIKNLAMLPAKIVSISLYIAQNMLYGNDSSDKIKVERILLLRTSALGDFIFAIPSMVALRKRFPKAIIILLTTTTTHKKTRSKVNRYAESKNTLPWLSFVEPSIIDSAYCFDSSMTKEVMSNIKPKITSFNPDLTFILSHPNDSGLGLLKKLIFLRMLGVQKNVFGWRMRTSNRFAMKLKYGLGLIEHKIMGPIRAIAECQAVSRTQEIEIEYSIYIDPRAEEWASSLWCILGWNDYKIIAIAPGSIQPHKCWQEDKFISLCKQLNEKYNVKFVILGTRDDQSLGDRIKKSLPDKIESIAGKSTIVQSAAVLKRCALLVGNDGGAMHLGAAMGCKVISIIPGIEYPGSIEPWGQSELAVRHDVSCAPCYSFTGCPKKHNKCMKDLPIEDVLSRCERVLNEKTGAK